MSTERHLVLGAGSVGLRRRLDPTAWVVFEQLLFESADDGDVWVASVSVRSLATELGVAKDTVARALTRLRDAGLVDGSQSRSETGVWSTGRYTLTIPSSITVVDHIPAPSPSPSPSPSFTSPPANRASRPTHRTATAAQLALPLSP